METWIDRDTVFAGRIVTVEKGTVRLEDGAEAQREVIQHPGAVGVVPVHNDKVILVEQYRVAVGETVLEIPAGKLEGDESPEYRGKTELEEETGYVAGRMVAAGSFYPSVGVLNETVHLFFALDLTKTEQKLEEDERIEIVEMPLDEARQRLADNRFADAKTIIGLHRYFAYDG